MKLNTSIIASMISGAFILATGAAHAGVTFNIGNSSAPAFSAPAAQVAETPGWHGDHYYDGHRNWDRKDWEAHQRTVQEHHNDRHDEHVQHEAANHEHDHDHQNGSFHHEN
jgi:hypothetical protein